MKLSVPAQFREAFFEIIRDGENSNSLKKAALAEQLADWTSALTRVTVAACGQMGWQASAKSHKLEFLPVQRSEYLTLDVVAFADAARRWRFPVAVMELENQLGDDQIGYSLWKVACVRANLRVVFCYRRTRKETAALIRYLHEEVIEAMGIQGRLKLDGDTIVVVGCHEEAATFPYGFFKWWVLEKNTGKFEQF